MPHPLDKYFVPGERRFQTAEELRAGSDALDAQIEQTLGGMSSGRDLLNQGPGARISDELGDVDYGHDMQFSEAQAAGDDIEFSPQEAGADPNDPHMFFDEAQADEMHFTPSQAADAEYATEDYNKWRDEQVAKQDYQRWMADQDTGAVVPNEMIAGTPGAEQGNPRLDRTEEINAEMAKQQPTIAAEHQAVLAEDQTKAQKQEEMQAAQEEKQRAKEQKAEVAQLQANQAAEKAGINLSGPAGVSQAYDQEMSSIARSAGADAAGIEQFTAAQVKAGQDKLDAIGDRELALKKLEQDERELSDLTSRMKDEAKNNVKRPSPTLSSYIAVALGGLLAPNYGGRNLALEQINKQVQAEVDMQMENRRARLSTMRTERGALKDKLQLHKDELVQRELLAAQSYQGAIELAKAKVDNVNLPIQVKEQGNQQIAQLERKRDEHEMKALAHAADQKRKQQKADDAHQKAIRRGPGKTEDKSRIIRPAEIDTAMREAGMDPDNNQHRNLASTVATTRTSDGKHVMTFKGVNAEQMKEYNKSARKTVVALDQMGQLARLSKESGIRAHTAYASTKLGQKIATRYNALLMELKEAFNLGVLNGPDLELMQKIIGKSSADVTNVTPAEMETGLSELHKVLSDNVRKHTKAVSLGSNAWSGTKFESFANTKSRDITAEEGTGIVEKVASESGRSAEEQEAKEGEKFTQKRGRKEETGDVKAGVHDELITATRSVLGDGINPSNIDEAKRQLKELRRVPKRSRVGLDLSTEGGKVDLGSGTDPVVLLERAINEYEKTGKSFSDTQAKVQKRQKKAKILKKAREKAASKYWKDN